MKIFQYILSLVNNEDYKKWSEEIEEHIWIGKVPGTDTILNYVCPCPPYFSLVAPYQCWYPKNRTKYTL